jgi:mannosyltransferase OCH1-like enzyme
MVRVTRGINVVEVAPQKATIDDQVSVVVPCYKQSSFVRDTIESVLAQTLLPKKIVVLLMDPDSWKLQTELNNRDPSIQAICSGRKLLPSARNFCIGVTDTKYVIPLDSDDTLPTNFIEELRKIDADVVYVGAKLFGAIEGLWPPTPDEEIDWDKQTTLRRNPIVCAALIKRSAWATIGGYSDILTAFEDMEFWIRLHEHGFDFKKCHMTWLNYRKHPETSMLKEATSNKETHTRLYREIVDLHPAYYGHIPKIIHYVWIGNAPKPSPLIDAWKKVLPSDWKIKEWNESNLDLTSNNAPRMLREAYAARKFGIAVDPIRAQVLHDYGGFWLDTDCILTRDITPFCQYDFVASYESEKWLNVGLVGARKGSTLMKKVLDYYRTIPFSNFAFYDHDTFINSIGTGPHVITRILQEMTNFVPDGMPQTLEVTTYGESRKYRLEPASTFTLNDESSGAYNYAIHLYSASWTDKVSDWAEVVRREYNKWKEAHNIAVWRG